MLRAPLSVFLFLLRISTHREYNIQNQKLLGAEEMFLIKVSIAEEYFFN